MRSLFKFDLLRFPGSRQLNPVLMLLSFLLTIGLPGCRDAFKLIQEDARESGATVRLQNFQRQEVSADGKQRWWIEAEEAFIYMNANKQEKLIVYNFIFLEFDDAGHLRNDVRAHRAELDYQKQLMYINGNIKSIGGSRSIQAEALTYNMQTKIMETDQPVIISDEGLYTRCSRGATIDTERNRQVCRGSTVIKESKPGPEPASDGNNELDIFQ